MSDPPRKNPHEWSGHPVKPSGSGAGHKRPRQEGGATAGDATAASAAAQAAVAAADSVNAPPRTVQDLRRANAQRWEEVVRLRQELLRRRRQQEQGNTSRNDELASGSTAGTRSRQHTSSPSELGGLDRRLAAYRSELSLLNPPEQQEMASSSASAAAAADDARGQQQRQQQLQHERNVRAIQSHRSMIQTAREHHSRIFGTEIIETYDGLVQVGAHLDRTIGVDRRRRQDLGEAVAPAAEQGEANSAADNSNNDGNGGLGPVVSLYDRIAEAEIRVEEHRLVHAALQDMLQRRENAAGSSSAGEAEMTPLDSGNNTESASGNVARALEQEHRERETSEHLRSDLAYFAQRLDAHLDRLEDVAATSVLEAREGDTLSDGNMDNGLAQGSNSLTSSSSLSRAPFLSTLFADLARRLVANREDPYVSAEAVIGAEHNSSQRRRSGSSSRERHQRRVERRRRIIDHLLSSGILARHPENPDFIRFIDYLE